MLGEIKISSWESRNLSNEYRIQPEFYQEVIIRIE